MATRLRAESFGSGKLRFSLVLADRDGCRCAPPRRDSIGKASMAASAPPNSLTSAPEGGRTDILAADQPEPGKALAPVEPDRRPRLARRLTAFSRQSAPPRLCASRPIFEAWRM